MMNVLVESSRLFLGTEAFGDETFVHPATSKRPFQIKNEIGNEGFTRKQALK
jgi:hypothetical protein